jgi:hypothetical protein
MSRVRRYSRSGLTAAPLRSPTGLSPSAVTRSSGLRLTGVRAARRLPPPPAHSSNPPQASPAGYAARGVWAPPRSLAATKGILSVPRGTEMFQFPRCPLRDRSQSARPCAGRVAPFGDPRIAGCQRLPGAFRRVAASFLGRQRQGIHHAPIMRRPSSGSRSPCSPMQRAPSRTGSRQQGRCRPPDSHPAPHRCSPHRAIPAGSGPSPPVRAVRLRLEPAGPSRPASRVARCCPRAASCRGVYVYQICAVRAGDPPRARLHQSRWEGSLGQTRAPNGPRSLPRPQNPAGSAWRVVKVPEDGSVFLRSADLGRRRYPPSPELSPPRQPLLAH